MLRLFFNPSKFLYSSIRCLSTKKVAESASTSKRTLTTDELPLSREMLTKLEQLSALRFQNQEEIESVEEDIRLAQKIFEVNTEGVEPLYSVVEEVINCPLRDDEPIETPIQRALQNAPVVVEDFLVVPAANVPQKDNPLFDALGYENSSSSEEKRP